MVSNTSHSLPMSHYQQESPIPKAHLPVRSSPVPRGGGPANTAVVTIDTGDMDDDLDDLPIPKRMKMSTSAAVTQSKRLVPGIPLSNPSALSISEVSAVRQLITGVFPCSCCEVLCVRFKACMGFPCIPFCGDVTR